MTDQIKGDEHNQVNGSKKRKRKRNKNKKNDNNTPVETSEPIPTPVYEDDIHPQNKKFKFNEEGEMEKPEELPEEEQPDLVSDQGEPYTEEPLPQHEGFEEIEVTDDIDQTEEPETNKKSINTLRINLNKSLNPNGKPLYIETTMMKTMRKKIILSIFHKIRFNLQPPPNNCYKLEKNCPFIIIKIKSLNT